MCYWLLGIVKNIYIGDVLHNCANSVKIGWHQKNAYAMDKEIWTNKGNKFSIKARPESLVARSQQCNPRLKDWPKELMPSEQTCFRDTSQYSDLTESYFCPFFSWFWEFWDIWVIWHIWGDWNFLGLLRLFFYREIETCFCLMIRARWVSTSPFGIPFCLLVQF